MSKLVGTHIYKYLKFSLKDHCRLVFEEPGSCVCWLIWKMFIYFKMPEGPQDDYFFGKQSTIYPFDGQELEGSPCWDWESETEIYIYIQGTLILRSRCISTYDVLLRLTKKNHGTAVEPWSLEPHGSACLVTSKVSSLHPYRWRLTSFIVWSPGGCHQDTGLSSSVSSWESCWDVHGETRRKTTGCGWLLHSPFLGFVGWWVLSGVCCFLFTPLGEVLMTCVCLCVFFSPPLTSIWKKSDFWEKTGPRWTSI